MWNFAAAEYLTYAGAPVNTVPASFSCWFQIDTAQNNCLVGVSDAGATTNQLTLYSYVTGGNLRVRAWPGGFAVANSTTNFAVNELHHAVAVFTSSTLRDIYFDGVWEGTNTLTINPSGGNRTRIGRRPAGDFQLLGSVGEVGVWDAALSANEIASLYDGTPTWMIRSSNLQMFIPLREAVSGGANDQSGWARHFTTVSTPTADFGYPIPMGPPWAVDYGQEPKKVYVEEPGFKAVQYRRRVYAPLLTM